ncbi:MAG: HNH endonuclease, partial [Oligoflexales bacterium]|nr:HNH endonuclease [Oligoflexales bacterium]
KRDPIRKEERIQKRKSLSLHKKEEPVGSEESCSNEKPSDSHPTIVGKKEYIPQKIRRDLLKRADYQCEYVSNDGRRCTSKIHLEMDHIFPEAYGGKAQPLNLQVLCKSHNLRKAEHDMGEEFIRSKILSAPYHQTTFSLGRADGAAPSQ